MGWGVTNIFLWVVYEILSDMLSEKDYRGHSGLGKHLILYCKHLILHCSSISYLFSFCYYFTSCNFVFNGNSCTLIINYFSLKCIFKLVGGALEN